MENFPKYDKEKEFLYISSDISIPKTELGSLEEIKEYLGAEGVLIEEKSNSLLIRADRDYVVDFENDILTVGYFEKGTINNKFYKII